MLDRTVLIYEQNSKIANYLNSVVKGLGFPTTVVTDHEIFLDKAAELTPGLVLFNASKENYKKCRDLANEIYTNLKISFLFITDKPTAENFKEEKFDFKYLFIIEPFKKSQLIDGIHSLIDENNNGSGKQETKKTSNSENPIGFFVSSVNKEEGKTEASQNENNDIIPKVVPSHNDHKPLLKSVLNATYSSNNFNEILNTVATSLQSGLNSVDFVSVYKLEDQKAALICSAGPEDKTINVPSSLNYSKGLPWASIISEDIVFIKDVNNSKYITDTEKQFGVKSCLSVPLKQNGITIGSLSLFSKADTKAYSDEDLEFFDTVSSQIEMTLGYLSKNEKLKQSEDCFKSLFDKSPVGVLLLDNDFRVYQCNRRIAEILQTTFDEIVGMDIRELGNEKFTAASRKMLKGSFTRCEFNIKIAGKRKDLWLMASLSPSKDSNNEVLGGMIVLEDISGRKKMENAITEEKEMLSITLRSIGDGVITTDSEGNILLFNRVAENITEWSQKDAEGKKLEEVLIWDSEANSNINDIQTGRDLQQGKIVGTKEEIKIRSKTDKQKVISASGSFIKDNDNNIVGNVIVFNDITEKQKLRQELVKVQKLESLETLAGGIAHDFNNILTGIIGNLSLSKMYVDTDDKIHKRLTEAEIECFKAADLTKQLINFAEGVSPNKKISSISELVKESVKFLLTGSKVKCTFECSENIWLVEVDQKQFIQSIYDIVLNSLQAMPDGGTINTSVQNVTIKQNVNNVTVDGEYVRIIIEDNGTGISEEHLAKIYDPYFTTKENHAGLGLSNTYTTIKSHKGFIKIDSSVDKGTKVSIYLPASRDVIPLLDEEVAQTVIGKQEDNDQHGKILVMDDDEVIREIAGSILCYLGYEVSFASDGKEAIDLYRDAYEGNQKYDVVIMDLTVPGGMGAEDTIKQLQNIDPEVKAIVTSGYSNAQIVSNFYKYGFKGAVIKPYKIEELTRTVKDVLVDKNMNTLPI